MTRRLVFDLSKYLFCCIVAFSGRPTLADWLRRKWVDETAGFHSYACKSARRSSILGVHSSLGRLFAGVGGPRERQSFRLMTRARSSLSFLWSQIIAPWFFPYIHEPLRFLFFTSSSSAPVLPPFIPELCNFLLATVPPRRAEIGVRFRRNVPRR